jgi:hypothetical protein
MDREMIFAVVLMAGATVGLAAVLLLNELDNAYLKTHCRPTGETRRYTALIPVGKTLMPAKMTSTLYICPGGEERWN